MAEATSPKVTWMGWSSPALALVALAVEWAGCALDRGLSRARGALFP